MIVRALLAAALAHPLDEATARVTLRDDHLDVTAEIDLLLLTRADATTLATAPDAALQAELDATRAALEAGVRLTVDGAPQALRVRAMPTPPELRMMAAAASAAGEAHGARVRVALDAPDAVPNARQVALTMPPAIGPALISFVEPAAAFTSPGAPATFSVARAPAGSWPLAGAFALGLCAGALLHRRSP